MNRRRGRVRRAGAGALLCVFAVLAVAGPAGAAAGPASAGGATESAGSAAAAAPSGAAVSGWSAAQASSFWTPARMRSAEPVEIAGPGAGGSSSGAAEPGAVGPPAPAPSDPAPPVPDAAPSSAPPRPLAPHSSFAEVPDPTDQVSRVNGAVFFEVEGDLARCSGTAVEAPNLSVVFTAGHCVHEGGGGGRGWYRGRWTFVPGYRFGQRPFGVFPAKWLDATRRWVSEGNENFDVAAAVVGRNERGQRLQAAVGADRIAFNLSPRQSFDVHGYPAGRPFDGETQRRCSGASFLGHDPQSVLYPGPLTLGVPCQVTGGASGGGWTIHGDVLNGVTDYGYPEDPQTAFGAYFGPEVKRLYQRVARFR